MYIKIKHIKQFLLVAACVFFAGFNYLTYANADNLRISKETYVCEKSIDSDCDELTNAEEKLYGTNANSSDSDGDGYSDGVEVKSGFDPSKPAPDDRIATSNTNPNISQATNALSSDTPSLTNSFSNKVTEFIASKDGQSVSVSDVQSLADSQISEAMGDPVTFDNLPEIDKSEIKILEQNYSSLSETDRKQKQKEDAANYVLQVAYLLANNSPMTISNGSDFTAFQEDFFSHFSDISDTSTDFEYFSDLGNRLEIFLNQVKEVEVPETMVDLHVKFLRLSKGILSLKNYPTSSDDPMGRMVLISKGNEYARLTSIFFQNDFKNYFDNLK